VKLEFCRRSFKKYSNVKLHENPSTENRVAPRGQTDGQTDMTKLIVIIVTFLKILRKRLKTRSKLTTSALPHISHKCVFPTGTIPRKWLNYLVPLTTTAATTQPHIPLKLSFKSCVHIFDSGKCWFNCISARVILGNCVLLGYKHTQLEESSTE